MRFVLRNNSGASPAVRLAWLQAIGWTLVTGLLALRFQQVHGLRFSSGDDLLVHHYWLAGRIAEMADGFAVNGGRWYMALMVRIYGWVVSRQSEGFYVFLNLGSLVAGAAVPVLALRSRLPAGFLLLGAALLLGFLPVLRDTPPASFPFVYTIAFVPLGLAAAALLRHAERGGIGWLIAAAAGFAAALPWYETVTLLGAIYIAAIVLIGFCTLPERAARRRLAFGALLLFVVLLAYVASYLLFRAAHPTQYPGTSMLLAEPENILQTAWVYTASASPLARLFDPMRLSLYDQLGGILGNAWVALDWRETLRAMLAGDVFFATAVGIATGVALLRLRRTGDLRVLALLLIASLGMLLASNALPALSGQYQSWVIGGHQNWTGTIFSFFAGVLALAALLAALRIVVPDGPAATLFAVLVGGAATILAGAAAVQTRVSLEHMHRYSAPWLALRTTAACEPFRADLESRALVAPGLFRYHYLQSAAEGDGNGRYWSLVLQQAIRRPVEVVRLLPDADQRPRLEFEYRVGVTGALEFAAWRQDAQADVKLLLPRYFYGVVQYRRNGQGEAVVAEPSVKSPPCRSGYVLTLPGPVELGSIIASASAPSHIEPAHYVLGQHVSMAGTTRSEFLVEGWSFAEPAGVWSTDQVSRLRMQLDRVPRNEVQLVLAGNAYLNQKIPARSFDVSVNGIVAGQLHYAEGTVEQSVPIVPGMIGADRMLNIEIRPREIASPQDVGIGDGRRLGLFLQGFRLQLPKR